ncbi:protein of unknown function [Aquiflexum balticum DSM 16537]|uniref:DUF4349 domain-containing protein n=1 Tax=Aquiflexum balticum DSM 16537 TaxID=758820 RepID=A0A1W2H3D4_9BACT|nr:DUF4349 domain-containing protein [Aquiflexum balticum]SMD42986.1 protein of unknown function [Aquiflexum balticum DSM 16537]
MKILFAIAFIIAACSNNETVDISSGGNSDDIMVNMDMESVPFAKQSSTTSESELYTPDISQKLVRSGSIYFQSEGLEKDYEQIKGMLSGFSAYLESENQINDNYRKSYSLRIRVPSEKYDSLFNTISKIAFRVESKYSNVDDVTERYYDLQSRIQNKKELEIRYREILSKANQVKDILEIERNLNEVRSDIELMEGQFNYLSKEIKFSSLQVQFYEELPYELNTPKKKGFWVRIFNALDNGWQIFLSVFVGLVTLWPFYLAGALVFVLVMYLKRKNKR